MIFITDPKFHSSIFYQITQSYQTQPSDLHTNLDIDVSDLDAMLMEAEGANYTAMTAEEAQLLAALQMTGELDSDLMASFSDAEITANVEQLLSLDIELDNTQIEVEVLEGRLILRGAVNAYWKKFQAEIEAYGVAGVLDVSNELAVVMAAQLTDEAIAHAVGSALHANLHAGANCISVVVQDGVVTLSGSLPNWSIWQGAHNAAMYTPGLVDLVDQLTVHDS